MKVPVYRAGEAPSRAYSIERKTKETQIAVNLCLDGGEVRVSTGIGFFDHMLTALAFYAGFGLELEAAGDLEVDGHHTVEDTGIVLGQALNHALGDRKGIRRFASAYIPMDEALCFTALDFSNRPYLVFDAAMPQPMIGGYDACLTEEFMRAFAVNSDSQTFNVENNIGNVFSDTRNYRKFMQDAVNLDSRYGTALQRR